MSSDKSDRAVLKQLRKRLCKFVGGCLADAVVLRTKGDAKGAAAADELGQRVGAEIVKLDEMLAPAMPKQVAVDASPPLEPSDANVREALQTLRQIEEVAPRCDEIFVATKCIPTPSSQDWRRLAAQWGDIPWSKYPQMRRLAMCVMKWLQSK